MATTPYCPRPSLLPSKYWGACATPPAALALQQQQQQQQQQKSRQTPPRRASSTPAPPLGHGRGHRCVGIEKEGGAASLVSGGATCSSSSNSGEVEWRPAGSVLLAMSMSTTAGEGDHKGDEDIWRDSALRYAGYANEVGESFRNIAPRLVVPSYAISIAYVLGDTVDKAYKDYSEGKGMVAVGKTGFDVLLWQSLASVAVPGLTINIAVKAVSAAMTSDQAKRLLGKVARKWAPTAVGLGVIPLIVHPIDHAVTLGMDETVRKWLA